MLPERDFRCNYHEVCDDPVCDGVGHCKDAALIVEVQKPSTNSQSVAALSEIVWDWLTENAVDVMVDECDVNILIQRLNSGVPELHT